MHRTSRTSLAPSASLRRTADSGCTTSSPPGCQNWLFPGTDLIASFAPFHGLPTPYRVSVDGRPGWYAQCGFEAVAVSFVFPGRTTIVDGACLDCGEPLRIVVRDGVIDAEEPRGLVGYVDVPFREWRANLPFA